MEHKGGLGRDGFEVTDNLFIIKQRAGKGDKFIPIKTITEVKASLGNKLTAALPMQAGNSSLMVAAGGKRYVVRRIPQAVAEAGRAALIAAM